MSKKVFYIDSGCPGSRVLLTAGVHGDEYEPILTAIELISSLPGCLVNGSVTIVPFCNESAYDSSSRFGEDGLDMARICPASPKGTGLAFTQITKLSLDFIYK
jgi:predicted deacylase